MKTGVGKYIIIFGLGAFIYGAIEVIVRGYTHWTMALTGGAVMALFMLINRSRDVNILLRCPLFTLGWLALSLPGFMLCTAVEKRLSSR